MKNLFPMFVCMTGLLLSAPAQHGEEAGGKPVPKAAAEAAAKPRSKPVISEPARNALAGAKELAMAVRGLRGPERTKALEAAASAYDKVVAEFTAEPWVAATAAFTAAETWRQQGSLALAEKDFLLAAQLDAERFAQRGLLGAADMQRRQKRYDEAMATYQKGAAVDPGSARAQEARLWLGRMLHDSERVDEAITAYQAALESAHAGQQTIDVCNWLAIAWIAKGDFDAAARAIDHAEQSVATLGDEDPIVLERLKKSLELMPAKRSLQRARDKQANAGKDAAALDAGKQ